MILEKQKNENLRTEIKKIKVSLEKFKEQITLLQRENQFLNEMIFLLNKNIF